MISALSVANFSHPDCLSAHLSVSLLIGLSISLIRYFSTGVPVISLNRLRSTWSSRRLLVFAHVHLSLCRSRCQFHDKSVRLFIFQPFCFLTVFAPLGYRSICKLHELDCSYLDMFCHHQYILFYTRTGMIPQNLNYQRQENSREKP